jgi:hypothetical protein
LRSRIFQAQIRHAALGERAAHSTVLAGTPIGGVNDQFPVMARLTRDLTTT